ncbi:MAG: glycosyltransferase, partial [Myxococcota bacterium]
VLYHIATTMRTIPTCRDALALPVAAELRKPSAPKVCIIVPAHNEQGVVGKLAASLVKQTYPNLSVVFALDRCTDGSAAEIREATGGADHMELLEIRECPPDWAGKVNAIRVAVATSKAAQAADLLLFTDADTEFDPDCVRAAVALLSSRSLGMLSIMSTLTTDRTFERISQPAAGMELMRQYPLARANALTHRRAFANGQFMLFTRAAYEQVGGHEAVKHALLEDIELARLVERRAIPAGLFFADNLLRCRMYVSNEEFVKGWKRIYIEAANRRIKRLETLARRARIVGTGLPVGVLLGALLLLSLGGPHIPAGLAAPAVIVALVGLAIYLTAILWSYRIARVPLIWSLLYPLGAWQTGTILHEAAADLRAGTPVRWGGREYVREAR